MIGSIKGIVEFKDYPYVFVDVNGVGYKVLLANNLLSKLNIGDKVKFFTHSHIREDVFDLYGFLSIDELKLFERIIGVDGVGPKTAMSVFSIGSKDEIINAIVKGDVAFFSGVPRLGRKSAQKIIIDLKDRLGSKEEFDLSAYDSKENKDIISVLKSFGFTSSEAQEAIRSLKDKDTTIEEKIKLALKYLGK
ncbi:MAG: Holliday junction branch migration protein RuvA [Patescibacteria group bacterium]|nr:Holliday junction branch migration protein RuvA [Patescibacteria group bacterium]